MKIWVAKTLVEDIDNMLNSCSVELFNSEEEAMKWADEEIDDYAESEDGIVTERNPHYYAMQAGDTYATIEIEEHEIR